MTEAFASYFGLSNFDAALVANYATVFHPLVLAAETFPVSYWSKDSRAEKPIAFRFERSIINCFGFGHLTMRPLPDLFR